MDVMLQIAILFVSIICIYWASKCQGNITNIIGAVLGITSSLIGIIQNWSVETIVVVGTTVQRINQSSDTFAFIFYVCLILSAILLILNGIVASTTLKED